MYLVCSFFLCWGVEGCGQGGGVDWGEERENDWVSLVWTWRCIGDRLDGLEMEVWCITSHCIALRRVAVLRCTFFTGLFCDWESADFVGLKGRRLGGSACVLRLVDIVLARHDVNLAQMLDGKMPGMQAVGGLLRNAKPLS